MTTRKQIKYIDGVKYSLQEGYVFENRIIIDRPIDTLFFSAIPNKDGTGSIWTLKPGFACDGPSGPTIDTPDSMRGAFEHDAKYAAMRMGLIDQKWRSVADNELEETLLEDGMNEERASSWHWGVKNFAKSCADPKNKRKILTAP